MASFNNVRTVGLAIEEGVEALKTAVDALDTTVSAWELRGLDAALPAEADMKQALADYDAIQKISPSLNDDLAAVRAVVVA